MSDKTKKQAKDHIKKIPQNLELIMIFMIAIIQIALIGISNASITQVSDVSKYGFMTSSDLYIDRILASLEDSNMDFRPDACKLISLYDEDLNLRVRFQFMKTIDRDLVNVNLEFRNYVTTHDLGYLNVETNESIEHVFFKWVNDFHEGSTAKVLVVVRVNEPTYFYVWVYPILSCLDIILIFVLILTIMSKRRQDGIEHYMALSNDRRYM